jgi:hypothetical protein
MSKTVPNRPASPEEVYAVVAVELRSRSAQIVQEIHGSIPTETDPPIHYYDNASRYHDDRAAAIAATVEYSLDAIERGGDWGPIPNALAEQVRHAAHVGVRPVALVRRYLAGHRRFMDFIREEIERAGDADHGAVLDHLRETYGSLLDHIVSSVEHEYERERERLACSPDQRRARLVQRLLIEDLDPAEMDELNYEVPTRWHLGMVAVGAEAVEALRRLKAASGRALLCVPADEGTLWASLATKGELTFAQFKLLLSTNGCSDAPLATGDPGKGLEGLRQSHEEAQVAVQLTGRESCGPTRCADILPIAGALQSEAIIGMYRKSYICPLDKLPKGGQPTRKALRAYFKHGRNASCAAGAIKATDRTVRNHLNEARKVLGAPLNLTGLEIALRLEELGYMTETEGTAPPL